jgi:hypothetical protein
MSIYYEVLERVVSGERFYINFEKRTMKIGGDTVIDNGEYDSSKTLFDGAYDPKSLLDMIAELYRIYKYSLPSERSDAKRKKYFKALLVDELTDEELIVGMPREKAQYMLEAFILCMIVDGYFVWNEELHGKWFYQCPSDPDLIILRSWIEGK